MPNLPEKLTAIVVGLVTFTLGGALTGSGMPLLGGLLLILSFPFGIVTLHWTIRRKREKWRRESEESHRAAQDAAEQKRELELYDMRQLEEEYNRLLSRGMRLDATYLREVVEPILTGHALGADEFERREFIMRDQAGRTQEIMDTLFVYDARIEFSCSEYDFKKRRFPIYLHFNDQSGPHHLAPRVSEGQAKTTPYRNSRLEGYIQMEDVEKARRFRQSNPSCKIATIIIRPIGTSEVSSGAYSHYLVVSWKLLGLRLVDGRTNRPLLPT